jgi:FKBP-type peptidyl-prolyl cis-trans isomerase SlpA
MSYPQNNDTVSLFYRGKLDNGELFKVVEKEEPLNVIIGNSDIPPTLEQAIMEMKVGETRKIRVSPDEGFGPRKKDLVQTIDSEEMIKKINPKPGMILSLNIDKDGTEQKIPATIMEVSGSKITVDYNHPLSGHHLTYDLTLVDIIKPESKE